MCLVQTKMDLVEQATVQNDEADHLASRLGLHFIKISTKENFNVDKVFMYLAKAWLTSGRDTAGEAAAAIHSGGSDSAKKATKEGFTDTPKVCNTYIQIIVFFLYDSKHTNTDYIG